MGTLSSRIRRPAFIIVGGFIALLSGVLLANTFIIPSAAAVPSYAANETNCQTIGGTLSTRYEGRDLVSTCTPPSVDKAPYTGYSIPDKIRSLLYYRAISQCSTAFLVSGKSSNANITRADAQSGNWFNGVDGPISSKPSSTYLGPYAREEFGTNKEGNTSCKNIGSIIDAAKTLWKIEYDNWFCAAGWVTTGALSYDSKSDGETNGYAASNKTDLDKAAGTCTNEALNGASVNTSFSYMFYEPDKAVDAAEPYENNIAPEDYITKTAEIARSLADVIRDKIYGGTEPELTSAMQYYYYLKTFFNSCSYPQSWSVDGKEAPPGIINPSKDIQLRIIDGYGDKVTDAQLWFKYGSGYGAKTSINTRIGAWADGLKPVVKTCEEMASYINNPTLGDPYKEALTHLTASQVDTGADAPIGESSCVIEGVGWIVCPAFNFLAGVADASYGVIEQFLKTPVSILNTSSGTYQVWQVMRTFANIGFVIVFLIIVFSQLTGAGITNYGVKKMLPRLIVAAILVNLSFFISQIAVDLSNILGNSIRPLFNSLPVFQSDPVTGDFATGNTFTSVVTGIIGGQMIIATVAAAGALAYFGGLSLLVPILLAGVLAILVTLLVLFARQAIIIILIIVSPLAFLAMLLPNTENLFKQWQKILIAMLIIYPAIALLFGASHLTSAVLIQAMPGPLGSLAGLAVMVLPLFVVPSLLKASLNAVPAVGNFANKLATRANGFAGKQFKEGYAKSTFGRGAAIRKQARANFRDRQLAERLSGEGARGALFRAAAGGTSIIGATKMQRAQTEALKRAATGTAASAQSEAIKQEMVLLQQQTGTDTGSIQRYIMNNHETMDDTKMQAASDLLLAAGGVNEYRSILKEPTIMATHARSLVESGRRNEGKVREKAADIANWMGMAEATSQIEGYSEDTMMPPEIDPETGLAKPLKSFIQGAYEKAEAAKLVTMDPETARLAEGFIDKEQAKAAIKDDALRNSAKKETQEVLKRRANAK